MFRDAVLAVGGDIRDRDVPRTQSDEIEVVGGLRSGANEFQARVAGREFLVHLLGKKDADDLRIRRDILELADEHNVSIRKRRLKEVPLGLIGFDKIDAHARRAYGVRPVKPTESCAIAPGV